MHIFDFSTRPPPFPELVREPVQLRLPQMSDFRAWRALREASREHLQAWEPPWREDEMTAKGFRHRVQAHWREARRGSSVPLHVFRTSDEALIGGITLSSIRYGASRTATVGYWIGVDYLRRGYGRAALEAVLNYAFSTLALNRIEAASQPENSASIALLRSFGFQREGLARNYLNINGAWRDHVLFALTASDRR